MIGEKEGEFHRFLSSFFFGRLKVFRLREGWVRRNHDFSRFRFRWRGKKFVCRKAYDLIAVWEIKAKSVRDLAPKEIAKLHLEMKDDPDFRKYEKELPQREDKIRQGYGQLEEKSLRRERPRAERLH